MCFNSNHWYWHGQKQFVEVNLHCGRPFNGQNDIIRKWATDTNAELCED